MPAVVGVTLQLPLVANEPLHAPLAVQEVAFVVDHSSVEDLPSVIDVGLAVTLTVGAGAMTVRFVAVEVEPFEPVQVTVYCGVPVVEGVTLLLPLVASDPLHAPPAVHELTLLLDQFRVADLPSVIAVGLAVRVTALEAVVTVKLSGDEDTFCGLDTETPWAPLCASAGTVALTCVSLTTVSAASETLPI